MYKPTARKSTYLPTLYYTSQISKCQVHTHPAITIPNQYSQREPVTSVTKQNNQHIIPQYDPIIMQHKHPLQTPSFQHSKIEQSEHQIKQNPSIYKTNQVGNTHRLSNRQKHSMPLPRNRRTLNTPTNYTITTCHGAFYKIEVNNSHAILTQFMKVTHKYQIAIYKRCIPSTQVTCTSNTIYTCKASFGIQPQPQYVNHVNHCKPTMQRNQQLYYTYTTTKSIKATLTIKNTQYTQTDTITNPAEQHHHGHTNHEAIAQCNSYLIPTCSRQHHNNSAKHLQQSIATTKRTCSTRKGQKTNQKRMQQQT
eukprot:gene3273-2255_t